MLSTIVCTVLLLAITKAQYVITFEFIAYSDNIHTLENLPNNYWDNFFDTLVDDFGAFWTWGDFDWPAVEDNYKDLALIVNTGELKWSSSSSEGRTAYENTRTLLNDFNPNDIQNYIAQYINSDIMFQVNGASQAIPGTMGSQYTFHFNRCLADDAQRAYLTAKCSARSDKTDLIHGTDGQWNWEDIWGTYIFPNAELLSSTYGTGYPDGTVVTIQFDYGYNSFEEFISDYQYNHGNITAEGITKTLYNNYGRLSDENVTMWIECDMLTSSCDDAEYCQYTLPWMYWCFTNETIAPTTQPTTYQPTTAIPTTQESTTTFVPTTTMTSTVSMNISSDDMTTSTVSMSGEHESMENTNGSRRNLIIGRTSRMLLTLSIGLLCVLQSHII